MGAGIPAVDLKSKTEWHNVLSAIICEILDCPSSILKITAVVTQLSRVNLKWYGYTHPVYELPEHENPKPKTSTVV